MILSDIQDLEIAMALSELKDKGIVTPVEVLCHKKKKNVLPYRRESDQIHQNVTLSHRVLQ